MRATSLVRAAKSILPSVSSITSITRQLIVNNKVSPIRTASNIFPISSTVNIACGKPIINEPIELKTSLAITNTLFNMQYEAREAKINITNLGGYSHILENISDLIDYLKNPKEFTKNGIKPPKGIILSGPPGTGKTYIAEAMAGQAGASIITVGASDLIGEYIGTTEKNLRNLFEAAKKAAPCILCIDEIDSLATSRLASPTSGSEHHINTVVNQFLTLAEKEHPGFIIVATTNNFDKLDPAIVRPGRFDRRIEIPLPEKKDRLSILRIHLQNKILDSSMDLENIARICTGFSPAQLTALVNEAAICAMREKSKAISQHHFDKARILITQGSYGRINENLESKKQTAIHESGHALIGHLLEQEVYAVSTLCNSNSRGYTELLPSESSCILKSTIENSICTALAGRAAEIMTDNIIVGSSSDLLKAKTLAYTLIKQEGLGKTLTGLTSEIEIEEILQQQLNRAIKLLREHKATHEALVAQLIKYNSLTREEFLNVVVGKKIKRSLISSFFPSSLTFNSSEKENFIQPNSTALGAENTDLTVSNKGP